MDMILPNNIVVYPTIYKEWVGLQELLRKWVIFIFVPLTMQNVFISPQNYKPNFIQKLLLK